MILGARITFLWRSKRPLPVLYNHSRSCSRRRLSSLSESQKLENEDDCFLTWLEGKAGCEISSVLSIGKSANGRSLFASTAIKSGENMLKVPFNVQISPHNLLPEIREALSDEVGDLAKLALVILVEQKVGQDSEWYPYISRLPRPQEMHNTIFWSKSELEMIVKSPVFVETVNLKNQIEKEFLAIRRDLEGFPKLLESITYDGFEHSYALVSSRAWQSMKGFSLIPFADFFNHNGTSKSVVLMDDDKQLSEVVADRNYAPGDEVLIRYGKFSNAILIADFGFALSSNDYDQVQIQVDIAEDDPLREMKLKFLQRSGKPGTQYNNSSNSSENYFTIKEVRLAGGSGRGLPQSLRACARILCCSSHPELNDLNIEAARSDGRLARHPLKNIGKEVASHRILLSRTTQLVDEYNDSIKSIGHVESHSTCEKLARRKQMARFLLTGELRVLESASVWLKNYCDTLTKNGFL